MLPGPERGLDLFLHPFGIAQAHSEAYPIPDRIIGGILIVALQREGHITRGNLGPVFGEILARLEVEGMLLLA
jgi:hypothetical protein